MSFAALRFAILGSGSKGNAVVIQSRRATVMVDCGFSVQEALARLGKIGLAPADLDAILITHEHGDHSRGAGALARRFSIPLWASAGTLASLRQSLKAGVATHPINVHGAFTIGDLTVRPVPVPHDAKEPCQYVFQSAGRSFGLLTDLGHITPHIVDAYRDCDAFMLEFNHDREMLMAGDYPPPLKARVGGGLGHLSNDQSRALLRALLPGRLSYVVAAHLSEANNTPELVAGALEETLAGYDCGFDIAGQHHVFDWYRV